MPTRPVAQVIKNREFLKTAGSTTALEAAQMLKQRHKSTLTVVDRYGRVEGICSERDLIHKVIAEGRDPAKTTVHDIMTRNPQTITADKPFCHAMHMMYEGGFRHLPVVDDSGHPIGIVSVRDALGMEMIEFGKDLEQRDCLAEIL